MAKKEPLADRWKDRASSWMERDVLGRSVSWCRYRGPDAHCHFPHRLHPMGTATMGWSVWTVDDRGPCPHDWVKQMTCPLSEQGHEAGGAPHPVAWEQGGQRDQPIEPTRHMLNPPKVRIGQVVRVSGTSLHCLVMIDGAAVTLDDGKTAPVTEIDYPTYHPTLGLQ